MGCSDTIIVLSERQRAPPSSSADVRSVDDVISF